MWSPKLKQDIEKNRKRPKTIHQEVVFLRPTVKDSVGFSYAVWSCDGYTVTCICAIALSVDLWMCVSAFFELNCTSQTRGHPYKLYKPRTCSSLSYFSIRVISVWNSLPADCVDFSSFASFKRAVKQADVTQFLLCYHVWLNITRICILHIIIISLLLALLSASLYVSRDVVGRWSLIVGWLVVGCHARALWPNGASYLRNFFTIG